MHFPSAPIIIPHRSLNRYQGDCYSCPNEVGNYRVFGPVRLSVCLSVCVCVCVSVCLHLFSDMVRPRGLVFGTLVGYRSGTKPIDFGVNGYIFKVKVMKI